MFLEKDIYTFLLNNKNYKSWDSGLNGRSAVSLFLFCYYKLNNDINAYNKGIELLEYEINNLNKVKTADLYNGLCGIAWTINYLSTKQIIEIDNDVFLPELLESQLKDLFFTNDKLISEEHFKLNVDILFYFIERFLTTNSESLKSEYHIFISQSLILFTHFFYQLDSNLSHFKLKNLVLFVKTLNLLVDNFTSPLLDSLLLQSIQLGVKNEDIKMQNINLSHFLKASLYVNNEKICNKLNKLILKNKSKKDNYNISKKNIGIWEHGCSYLGLKLIVDEQCSLQYFLD